MVDKPRWTSIKVKMNEADKGAVLIQGVPKGLLFGIQVKHESVCSWSDIMGKLVVQGPRNHMIAS